jgi:hypothetical protein
MNDVLLGMENVYMGLLLRPNSEVQDTKMKFG